MGCITGELVVKMASLTTANATWEFLAAEFSLGGDSMYWFRRLTRYMESGGDVSAPLDAYQEALSSTSRTPISLSLTG